MRRNHFIPLILIAALAGCAVDGDYRRPAADLPGSWGAPAAQGKPVAGEQWWSVYGDAALDRYVAEALQHNQDLALATARLDEARALARVADAGLVPSVDAAFQRDRSRRSDSTAMRFPGALENNNYRAQLNVSYEIDLWGRLRGSAKAAHA
ncbi:MAG: TolC family protein [Burkholderiales bacterium]